MTEAKLGSGEINSKAKIQETFHFLGTNSFLIYFNKKRISFPLVSYRIMQADNKKLLCELVLRLSSKGIEDVRQIILAQKGGKRYLEIFNQFFPKLRSKKKSVESNHSDKYLAKAHKVLSQIVISYLASKISTGTNPLDSIRNEIVWCLENGFELRSLRVCHENIQRAIQKEEFLIAEEFYALIWEIVQRVNVSAISVDFFDQLDGEINQLRNAKSEFENLFRVFSITLVPFVKNKHQFGETENTLKDQLGAMLNSLQIPTLSKKAQFLYWYSKAYLSRIKGNWEKAYTQMEVAIKLTHEADWVQSFALKVSPNFLLQYLHDCCNVRNEEMVEILLSKLSNQSKSLNGVGNWYHLVGLLIVSEAFEDPLKQILAERKFLQYWERLHDKIPAHLFVSTTYLILKLKILFGNTTSFLTILNTFNSISKPNLKMEFHVYSKVLAIVYHQRSNDFLEANRLSVNAMKGLKYAGLNSKLPIAEIFFRFSSSFSSFHGKKNLNLAQKALKGIKSLSKPSVPENFYFDIEKELEAIIGKITASQ